MFNRYLAEAVGTFCMVFMGCGAIVVSELYAGTLGHTGVSLVFGLVVMAMIYSLGNISGAHINPAVTVAFHAAGRLPRAQVPPYVISQFAGAIAAGLLLRLLFPEHLAQGGALGATLPSGAIAQAFVMEVLLSFVLMFVILNVSTGHKEKGIMAGVAVGGTVAMAAMMGGPVSGASMNPARSLGPALWSGELQHLWIYLVAPVVGTLLASPTCRWVQGPDCCPDTPQAEAEAEATQ